MGLSACKHLVLEKYKIYISDSENKEIFSFRAISAYIKRIIRTVFLNFKDRPDVVVCSSHLLYDTLPGYILQLRFRTRLVVYVHHIISEHADNRSGLLNKLSILNEKLSLSLIRQANIVFVVNEEVRTKLINIGFKPSKILLSTNGIDYKAIDSINTTDEIMYDGCFCGRLVKSKGVYDLIEIWKLVTIRYPDSVLVIVGDGHEYKSMIENIKKAHLERNIQFTGFVPEEEKLLAMRRSKVFVYPSYEEGWGIAVGEAIASGLAVVLYDLGVYKAFDGYVIKVVKGDKNKMAEAVIQMIENYNRKNTEDRKLVRIESVNDWKDIATNELESIKSLEHNM